MARAAVTKRLNDPASDRKDILNRLTEARDENGESLSFDELVAEAISMLIGVGVSSPFVDISVRLLSRMLLCTGL